MKRCLLVCCLAWSLQAVGATPHVPTKMWLADISLQLTQEAKERIQEKIDSLTKSEKHFQALLDRVNLFLPIVERVLEEEGIPQDFRYQVIQESAMVSDAVHASDTVGFWQFKEYTALEVGLQVNEKFDERMHIIASTRGAAKYLKKNNTHLDNWLYTLLAYNRGRGYVEKLDYKKYRGAKQMRINGQTHWYIIHFLAHKLVFEGKVGRERHPKLYLHEYKEAYGKTLGEIAKVFGVDKKQLKAYNKWLKRYRIPHNATYGAIVPMTHQQYARSSAVKGKLTLAKYKIDYAQYWERAAEFPVITTASNKKSGTAFTEINGVVGTLAQPGDSLTSLAQAGNLSLAQFLAVNDIDQDHLIVPGQVYYYKAKQNKARVHFHIARPGETWWGIAQKYGIKKAELLLKNRLRKEVVLKPGRVLWLRFIRPAKIPIAYEYRKDGQSP